AAVAQRPVAERALPRGRRRARGRALRALRDRRRDRRLRRRADELRAAPPARPSSRAGLPVRFRPAVARRPRRPRAAAPHAQAAAARGAALRGTGPAHPAPPWGAGEALFAEACRQGWEGVIAKRADSPYRATRSKDWLKFKCEKGQELVIGG